MQRKKIGGKSGIVKEEEEERQGGMGQRCRACSGGLVADCLALCCCPLAAITLLALAFIKVPYALGKRCLRLGLPRTKKASLGYATSNAHTISKDDIDLQLQVLEHRRKSLCTGFIELDNVLLDLYQVGHLGFGRLSFTGGIQPNPNTN